MIKANPAMLASVEREGSSLRGETKDGTNLKTGTGKTTRYKPAELKI